MKKTAIIIGILFLIQFIIGVLLNQFLIGPITFSSDYLTNVSTHSTQLTIGGGISILSGIISVLIAVKLLPLFKPYNSTLAFLYFGFSIVNFTIILIDLIGIFSLLSVSQEYVQSNAIDTSNNLKNLGTVFYAIRGWTHYLVLLISGATLFALYSAFFHSKLLPRFISIWGLVSVLLMIVALILSIFSMITFDTEMMLFIPLALNQLFLIFWLFIKGFPILETPNPPTPKIDYTLKIN